MSVPKRKEKHMLTAYIVNFKLIARPEKHNRAASTIYRF